MPNATVRADARALPEATNRRAVLCGMLITGAAVATPAIASAVGRADDLANKLWGQRHALRQPYIDAWAAISHAEAQLPEWARHGPSLLNPDGTLSAASSGWPAIQGVEPDKDRAVLIRPGKVHLTRRYQMDLILQPETALSDYRQGRRELASRLRAQRSERSRLGLPALEAARDLISDQHKAIREEIEELEPDTANAAGALVLCEAALMCNFRHSFFEMSEWPTSEIALKFLRPSLTGLIRAHVDEIFNRPDVPAGLLQAVNPSCAPDEYDEDEAA
jgi:hypothetical protein